MNSRLADELLASSATITEYSSDTLELTESGLGSSNSPVKKELCTTFPISGVLDAIDEDDRLRITQRQPGLSEDDLFDKYELGSEAGEGGCAIVFEAWRRADEQHVVVKLLKTPNSLSENDKRIAIKRFHREAEIIKSLSEIHIIKCLDFGNFNGIPCMVLEFCTGETLDDLLKDYPVLSLKEASNIIIQILQALEASHNNCIIHRDIKPSNIMVLNQEPPFDIKVLDFGISTVLEGMESKTLMTQVGTVRGTPAFMAPELISGTIRASAESDLYAVGLVFYEMLVGHPAITGETFMSVAYKQVNEYLQIPCSVPSRIANIILKLTHKTPSKRYHRAKDVIHDIRKNLPRALAEEETCIAQYKKSGKMLSLKPKETSGNKMLFVIGIAVATVIAILAVVIVIILMKDSAEPAQVQEPQAPIVEPAIEEAPKAEIPATVDVVQPSVTAPSVEEQKPISEPAESWQLRRKQTVHDPF